MVSFLMNGARRTGSLDTRHGLLERSQQQEKHERHTQREERASSQNDECDHLSRECR